METSEETPLLSPTTRERYRFGWRDWIPAIVVAILFLLTAGFIFQNVESRDPNSSIITSKIIQYPSTLKEIRVLCVGSRACELNIERDRKYPKDVTLSYFVESSERKGSRFIQLNVTFVENSLSIVFNSTGFPQERTLAAHFNVFLPDPMADIPIHFDTEVGNLDILGIPTRLGTINAKIGSGNVLVQDVHASQMKISTFAGNIELKNTLVDGDIAAFANVGDIRLKSQLNADIDSKKGVNVTTEAGSIVADLDFYDTLYARSSAGSIRMDVEPREFSETNASARVGDIQISFVRIINEERVSRAL
jgi:DUF4097 and DUF4098 domain-containing protein YvlB